jgi:hypothetical protein
MPSKFGGIPVDEATGSKFGGVPLKADFSDVQSTVSQSGPGAGKRVKRDLGLSTRNVVEGVGDLVGIFADPLILGWNAATGDDQLTTREGWGAGLDRLGVPRASTSSERVQADAGRALTGTALTLGAGSLLGIGTRAGQFLTAAPRL